MEPKPYLGKEREVRRKPRKKSNDYVRLNSNPATSVYQFRKQNLSVTGGSFERNSETFSVDG